jgi:hypothetical protein
MTRDRGDTTRFGLPPVGAAFASFPSEPPLDVPLAELARWWLEIQCSCGKMVQLPLRRLAADLGWAMTLGSALPRLKCRRCGKAPKLVRIVNDPGGEAGRAGAKVIAHRLV